MILWDLIPSCVKDIVNNPSLRARALLLQRSNCLPVLPGLYRSQIMLAPRQYHRVERQYDTARHKAITHWPTDQVGLLRHQQAASHHQMSARSGKASRIFDFIQTTDLK
jgi:hypothetical protein